MTVGSIIKMALLVMATLLLIVRPASAWLIEPSPSNVHYKEFKEAAIGLIVQVDQIVNSWIKSQRKETNLELPSSETLRNIAKQFQSFAQDTQHSANIPFTAELKVYAGKEAERLQINVPGTYSEAYGIFADARIALAEQLDTVRNSNFGPSSSTDLKKREAFGQLVGRMFRLVAIGNYLTVLLQYQGT